MRRRKFMTLLGGAIGTWPLAAAGQQGQRSNRLPIVGFVGFASESVDARTLIPFREAMSALGYVEGQSIVIQVRSSQGDVDRGHALLCPCRFDRSAALWRTSSTSSSPRSPVRSTLRSVKSSGFRDDNSVQTPGR